jgi:diguanylate cyclase (GGDEF)-like protein
MKHSRPPRDLWASLVPIAWAALVLAAAYQFPTLAPVEPLPAGLLLALALAGAAGACHRPAAGSATLGLGAAALPAALLLGAGAAPVALLAAAVFLIAELTLRLGRRLAAIQPPERRGFWPRSLEAASRTALATLAAGGAWVFWTGLAGRSVGGALTAAVAGYLLVAIGLEIADRKIRRPEQPLRFDNILFILFPLGVDVGGWVIGSVLGLAGRATGRPLAAALLVAFAALMIEAVRNGLLLEKTQNRARDLERLRRAGQRMSTPAEEMASIADRIRIECARVIPTVHWFQFEALAPGSEFKSWWWGPRSEALEEGVPEPDVYPPALPGFHRRSNWQILERHLRSRPDGLVLGRLRLWCDPRRVDPRQVELLDRLLPQMTGSVQRLLLDREAKEDPLTGVAMRRVLERRLTEVHARCMDQGGAMSVVLCDLDHFKRINDTFGHPVGDAALVAVAGVLKQMRRASDLCCRYGGEEFVLLLEATAGADALSIAERLRHSVEELVFEADGERVPLTLSAGVASFPELYIKTAAELLLFADEALYESKRRGRNRCLLDIGQGRYLDKDRNLLTTEDAPPVQEPPRIFA